MITKNKAVELIERAVTERGADWVDPRSGFFGKGCKYVVAGQPGCIVGTAYAFAGATVEQLAAMDSRGDAAYDTSIDALMDSDALGTLPVETTEAAAHVFRTAQRVQDNGRTWGEALAAARETAAACGAAE